MKKQATSSNKKFSDEEIDKELELAKARDAKNPTEPKNSLHKKYYDSAEADVQKTINPENFDLKK